MSEKTSFEALVHIYSSRLHSTAAYITKNPYVAEDIVQEAFLALWKKREEIVLDNPGGWLYMVVYKLACKHLKKESRRARLHTALRVTKPGSYTEVEERLIDQEKMAALNKVCSRLPLMQEKVYRLSRQEGLSRNEIASHLNISPNTVKVHLQRAAQYIKDHIGVACLLFTFFIFNNIFFKTGNTNTGFRELYKVKSTHEKKSPTYDTPESFSYHPCSFPVSQRPCATRLCATLP